MSSASVLPQNGNLKRDDFPQPQTVGINEKLNGGAKGYSNGWHNGDQSAVTIIGPNDVNIGKLGLQDKGGFIPRRRDEHDVDFSDTRRFSVFRWNEITRTTVAKISPSDIKVAAKFRDWEDLAAEIQTKITDPSSTQIMKRHMNRLHPLPQVLAILTRLFTNLVVPIDVNFEIIWVLIYLNLRLSYASPDRLRRTSDLLNKIRRVVELFTRCLQACDEPNEARIAAVDFLDPITIILTESIAYLHECYSDKAADHAWPDLSQSINQQLATLDQTVKHLSDITSYSKVNQERRVRNMSLRHALIPENEEPGTFPNRILPFKQNKKFYGRKDELDKILTSLRPKDDQSLRTYTIYGRRGVGKTEIALEFAYTNPAGFDALFWIQCETSVAIRQSFTDVAVSLNLPGADRDGHHEENLLAVQDWLKKTKKRWLMIFDNAERNQILRGYWPVGASGAILITSRKYYNFAKDIQRNGNTIKPFDEKQSWELLLKLLGEDWEKLEREGKLTSSETLAARHLLADLEGLALAIQQAAILIRDPDIGGPTISKTYEMFKERIRTLPERHSSVRSTSEKALDALWSITFNSLTKNARILLGVLAWLSPDAIPIDLFLPQNQLALSGILDFCKQKSMHIDANNRATLASVANPSEKLESAISELLQRKLIKQDNRLLSIHRVVQEATSYHDVGDLQTSFDAATKLVAEQFPKRKMNESLFKDWKICQTYIPHGVYLSKKFEEHSGSGVLSGPPVFVKLLSTCAWYLYEIGDYEVCLRVMETAMLACNDKTSLVYAELRDIAGSRWFDSNKLAECRQAWEETARIRREILAHDDPGIAGIYNNLGNLELATGNTEEASTYYDKALQIWVAGGDDTASHLALTYLCVGRVHMLCGEFKEANKLTSQAESLFLRTIGEGKGFMANVHYAYGNIHFRQKHWIFAWRSFDSCLKIGLATMPLHPITAAAYYSLGCVELAQGNPEPAKGFLDKARKIAELRSPTRDDGPLARILWKTAEVLSGLSDPLGLLAEEAEALRTRALLAQQELVASGEGGQIPFADEDVLYDRNKKEDAYDVLVPLFYR